VIQRDHTSESNEPRRRDRQPDRDWLLASRPAFVPDEVVIHGLAEEVREARVLLRDCIDRQLVVGQLGLVLIVRPRHVTQGVEPWWGDWAEQGDVGYAPARAAVTPQMSELSDQARGQHLCLGTEVVAPQLAHCR